jgi:hypothetical protein
VLSLAQSSVRIGPMGGFLGLDMGVVIALAQVFNFDAGAVTELIGAAQPVIIEKMNENSGR